MAIVNPLNSNYYNDLNLQNPSSIDAYRAGMGIVGEPASLPINNSGAQGLAQSITSVPGNISPYRTAYDFNRDQYGNLQRNLQIPEYNDMNTEFNQPLQATSPARVNVPAVELPASFKYPEGSKDTNTLEPEKMPYFNAFAQPLDRISQGVEGVGNIGAYGNAAGETINAMGSALSLGTGILGAVREVKGAKASMRATQQTMNDARQRRLQAQRDAGIQYAAEGGSVHLSSGDVFSPTSLTGEYLYPLPKSMQDKSNVEVEKGEYVQFPDGGAPMEALGEKHTKGGTPVSVPDDTNVISDQLTFTRQQAKHFRDKYNLNLTHKNTYATSLDKYKSKIGLKQAYKDQEKILKKIEKNQKEVKDENTSVLNASVLSKQLEESQNDINALEALFAKFSDEVFEAQEELKYEEDKKKYFDNGGTVRDEFYKTIKNYNIPEDAAIRAFVHEAKIQDYATKPMSELVKMANGDNAKVVSEAKKRKAQTLGDLIKNTYGRQLNFTAGQSYNRELLNNPGDSLSDNQLYQPTNGIGFGKAGTRASVANFLRANPWAGYQGLISGDSIAGNVSDIQAGHNAILDTYSLLGESGAIANTDRVNDFVGSQYLTPVDGNRTVTSNMDKQNSRLLDNKWGQTTANLVIGGLDVLTPQDKQALNNAGIYSYSQATENLDKVKGLMTDDSFNKFKTLVDSGHFDGSDFLLESYMDQAPMLEEPEDYNPELSPVALPADEAAASPSGVRRENNTRAARTRMPSIRSLADSLYSPEMLRLTPSAVTLEGLEQTRPAHIDPVLQSPDLYMTEQARVLNSQIDSLGSVPDSQRAALMATLNATAQTALGRQMSEIDNANANRRMAAQEFNETQYKTAYDQNIGLRQQYEAGYLKAEALNEENWARYYDSINNQYMQEANIRNTVNTLESVYPDMVVLPDGRIVYAPSQKNIVNTAPTPSKVGEDQYAMAKANSRRNTTKNS